MVRRGIALTSVGRTAMGLTVSDSAHSVDIPCTQVCNARRMAPPRVTLGHGTRAVDGPGPGAHSYDERRCAFPG